MHLCLFVCGWSRVCRYVFHVVRHSRCSSGGAMEDSWWTTSQSMLDAHDVY